ncbi:hypothetical protein FQN57_000654 [Myotisia sp. PD_48]|nr:hypothetical protein FQN57_000654 [Myotisia sp. PD_48]
MSTGKPTLLYIGSPIMVHLDRWNHFQSSFNIHYYNKLPKQELIAEFAPGGKFSNIDGIIRPNNSHIGVFPFFNKDLIPHLPPSCKIISSVNHGYDGEDTEELGRRGIWYCNGAGAANDSTADTALFLLLSAFRYTTYCENKVRTLGRGKFGDIEAAILPTAQNPRDKVLGIIGMGEIGQAVAQRALALGMTIHYFSRTRKNSAIEEKLGNAVFHPELASLLGVADCLVLACPHTPETHHLLNADTFKQMKRGVRVVNVGRGKCVDEEALADAIDDGIVAGVGLDVYHDEPTINPRLLKNWNITLLPHIGGGSRDTVGNFEKLAMDNIEAFFLGDGKPITPVNKVG